MVSSLNLLVVILCVSGALAANNYKFATYDRLFSAKSLWNSRPVNPVFSTDPRAVIQPSINAWYPVISQGDLSTGIFLAKATDLPVTVYGLEWNSFKINNVDAYEYQNNITIPRWPADSVPATGGDGHMDIVDPISGIVHSFWVLRYNNVTRKWAANQYAWTPLNGTGWGHPAHYFQGARAAGVPTSGGLIRKNEVNDGNALFYHALCMSLAHNSLGFNPAYVYPATSADWDAETTNSGFIPEGALLMLPASYNSSKHNAYPQLKKVVETLKVYGAYVVDRNTATPYALYVEHNSGWKMTNKTGWDGNLASQLQAVSDALRMVVSASSYLDGDSKRLLPDTSMSMLSMRSTSAWTRQSGDAVLKYDTWAQALVYSTNNYAETVHTNKDNKGYNKVNWGKFIVNNNYTFSVESSAGAQMYIDVLVNGKSIQHSPYLGNGQNYTFKYPLNGYMYLIAKKPAGGPGFVRGLIKTSQNVAFPAITPMTKG